MNRISAFLLFACCAVCFAQVPQIKSGSTVYIEPNHEYETYLAAASMEKRVPLILVTPKDNAENSGGIGLLLFIGVLVFSLYRSGKKLRTAAYTGMWVVIAFIAFTVLGYFSSIPGEAVGEMGLMIGLLAGMLAALVHSRRNANAKPPRISQNT